MKVCRGEEGGGEKRKVQKKSETTKVGGWMGRLLEELQDYPGSLVRIS